MKSFHSILIEHRENKGIGVRELSRMLNISPTHLRRLETNISKPSEDLVRKMAVKLDLDFDELMISAKRIPIDIQEYLLKHPSELRRIRSQITTQITTE